MSETTNLGRVAMVPKGTWDNTATYSKLNVVTYGGSSYVALKAVPAGTAVSNTSYWQLIAEKGNTGGIAQMANAFSQTTDYTVGDYCTYGDDLYKFITAHPAAKWDTTEVTAITTTAFDYNESYSIGDIVSYNGSFYTFTSAHTAGDAWNYDEVSSISADAFIATQTYETGDYVIYNNDLYKYTSDHYTGPWDADAVTAVTAMDEIGAVIQESVFEVTESNGVWYLTWHGAQAECPFSVSLSGTDYILSFNY